MKSGTVTGQKMILKLFTCPRHVGGLRLTPASCGKMYLRARSHHEGCEALAECRGCSIGARHVGEKLSKADTAVAAIEQICTRCHRGASRFIRGNICPSCYNRERELLAGRNAKGTFPVRARRLVSVTALYTDGAKLITRTFQHVADLMEVELRVLRAESRAVRFLPVGPAAPGQSSFWGGV